MNKLLSSEYVRKCDYSEKNVTCGSEPTSAKSPLMSVHNMNTFLIPEHIIKCKYSKINTCSVHNNNNNDNSKYDDNNYNKGNGNDENANNYNNSNNEDEIVSFMSITVVKNIF